MSNCTSKARIRKTNNRDARLLAEVNSSCPLCGKGLLTEKNGRQIKLYENAHIYPHSPTQQQLQALKGISPPSDIEALDNLIPLCPKCHTIYDSFTTQAEYQKLRGIKDRKLVAYELKNNLASIEVEEEVSKVIHELGSTSVFDVTDLQFNPIPIKDKIPPGVLREKVINLATLYAPYIKSQFQQLDCKKGNKFQLIATQFKLAFQKASQTIFLLEEIYYQLVEWLKNKTFGTPTACEVVICFFIHDCEVFNVITK